MFAIGQADLLIIDVGTQDSKQAAAHVVSLLNHVRVLSCSDLSKLFLASFPNSQVDSVMGGKSSGELPFLESNTVMNFIGIINHLGGGGFSSVIRSFNYAIELFRVQGLWWSLELETTNA